MPAKRARPRQDPARVRAWLAGDHRVHDGNIAAYYRNVSGKVGRRPAGGLAGIGRFCRPKILFQLNDLEGAGEGRGEEMISQIETCPADHLSLIQSSLAGARPGLVQRVGISLVR